MPSPAPIPSNPTAIPRVLTIAGSDSGGGAGIQADLKVFGALGAYGMSAITALTAQNTVGVQGIHEAPPDFVRQQIAAVLEDIGADAIKTGMLASAAIVEAVADTLERFAYVPLVVDPVMVAKSGDSLLHENARTALIERLLPRTEIVTPNMEEAAALAGIPVEDEASMCEAAKRISALGPRYTLVKGGHLGGADARDYLFDGESFEVFSGPRIKTKNTHGTGCTFASAIAVYLARGLSAPNAVRAAKDYLTGALRHSLPLGQGHGPLDHAWPQRG